MTKNESRARTTNPKRRKSAAPTPTPTAREPTPDEVLYEVRDIIAEKVERGKLLYKVDWADHPATGERYDPTWEPAENVTEAAVADWQREKLRRQEPRRASSNSRPSTAGDLDERAKGAGHFLLSQEHDRASAHHRASVDSGYTSSPGDDAASFPRVQALPRRTSRIVCEIPATPAFDPSEFLVISSSQSGPSSQANVIPSDDSEQKPKGRVSQRTIADSQGFESLHTQATTQPATQPASRSLSSQQASHLASGGTPQEADRELSSNTLGRSILDIPSRQLEGSQHVSEHSSVLHDGTVDPAQSPRLGSISLPSSSSPWAEGFLTQPDYQPITGDGVEESQSGELHSSRLAFSSQVHQSVEQPDPEATIVPASSLPDTSASHRHSQAAQRIPAAETNPGQILTQVSKVLSQSEVVVSETTHKAYRENPPCGAHISQSTSGARSTRNEEQTNTDMNDPSDEPSRSSAVDLMRQIQAQVFGTAPAPDSSAAPLPSIVSPSSIPLGLGNLTQHLEAAATPPRDSNAVPGVHDLEFAPPPATVAPSDLTTSVENLSGVDHTHSHLDDFGLDMEAEEQDDDGNGRHFTVTLPMAANTRQTYLDTITDNRATMMRFGEVFTFENSQERIPGAAMVAKMDAIFERLLDLCDLPAYDDSIPDMSKVDKMKHATGSNSKFSFIYEFLKGLEGINVRVLILSQPGRVFDYIEAVVLATDVPYSILGQEGSNPQLTESMSVVLAVAGQDLSLVEGGVDVVIAFDHTARSVELPATLNYESMAPIVLALVATYSLEHIDQQLLEMEPDLAILERKNALNLATAEAAKYLRSPERQYPEPHEAAKIFADFLRSPEGGLDWEPHPLPADVFEFWMSSQEHTQSQEQRHLDGSNGPARKRPLDDIDEGTPKRPRLLLESQQPSRNATPARMSDLLKKTLENHPVSGRTATPQTVEIPIEQLESMVNKIAELETRLSTQNSIEEKLREHVTSLETQLRSHEQSIKTIQPKYMEALRDRGTFEKECTSALAKATAATERLEAQRAELHSYKQKNADLTTLLTEAQERLANSTIPDIARLATAEKARDDALAQAEKAHKKALASQNEADYSRKAYQDASNAHSELRRDHLALQRKVADLERKAADNLLRIHQVQAAAEAAEAGRVVDELKATLESRERELDRAKEELRALKSGRRETRGASVPRSPRMGVSMAGLMMSPRTGRGAGGGGGGQASRGTSPSAQQLLSSDGPTGRDGGGNGGGGGGAIGPVPGMNFFPPLGNGGRWGHLRE